MTELICIAEKTCTERVTWCRKTQFAGDHHYCDEHARAEKDFGKDSSTTVWFQIDRIDLNSFEHHVDKPFSVREFMDKARAAGRDALGIANDPEAIALIEAGKGVTSLAAAAKARELVNMPVEPINHHTRAPNQPTEATIVEGDLVKDHLDDSRNVEYRVRLNRKGPGDVEFVLWLNGTVCGRLPFDNLVKAATRIDPDHAVGPEKQIQQLRQEAAEAKARMYDWQAKAMQLETKVAKLEEAQRAFSEASKA